MKKQLLILILLCCSIIEITAQHSIARQWNEKVLSAIRADFARPTVHARNLFHISAAMYDAWAIYEPNADTYFLGKTVNGYTTPLQKSLAPADIRLAQEEAITYAAYRILKHRFAQAPRAELLFVELDELMDELGYDKDNNSLDYACEPAGMGNYIAQNIIAFGLTDGSNETNAYENLYYEPINYPLLIEFTGNSTISNMNRWQPLEFSTFIDQSGTRLEDNVPDFLSPEWGNVYPFSLKETDADYFERDGNTYKVYHDPAAPPYLSLTDTGGLSEEYKWGNALVSVWSSHLDATDGVMWDISPASIGNVTNYPTDIVGLRNFYNTIDGGDPSLGHAINPFTNQPYTPQVVPRGDYARVLAEFWADGPDSETPPGHWFAILNYVNDNANLEKRFKGQGEILSDLEWDIKSYFILGGAMHDAAISAWGIKGWYDYVRPVSAIRGMAELGQSADPNLPSYHLGGLPLIPGYIEMIEAGDPLEGQTGQYIGEVKIKAWRGPDFINIPTYDVAGVDWIRAKVWYPYQRPTFVTPPFAGYVSGHSTYSRAAAEVLTTLTGDPFFPGGMGEFFCGKNSFLVFEDGPSIDITLQWATYRDASDQCSLSRIWGGIHPPCDDIPGRKIGEIIGLDAFAYAEQYFTAPIVNPTTVTTSLYPNPTQCLTTIHFDYEGTMPVEVLQSNGQLVKSETLTFTGNEALLNLHGFSKGIYFIRGFDASGKQQFVEKIVLVE